MKEPEGRLRYVEYLDLGELVLRERGQGYNKDWGGCRRTPKAEIGGLPQGDAVAKAQAWDNGTVE